MSHDLPTREDVFLGAPSKIVDGERFTARTLAVRHDADVVESAVELPEDDVPWLPVLKGIWRDPVRQRLAI
jgi:hypothetical protein